MSLLSELKELNKDTAVRVCVFFFAFVSPGVLSIYSLNPELVATLETTKLLLLSVSITAPSFMFLFITTMVADRVLTQMGYLQHGTLGGFSDWYITNGLANAQLFYFVSLISFIFHLTRLAFILWLLGLFVCLIIHEFVRVIKFARSKQFNPRISDPADHP